MTPAAFIAKWAAADLSERASKADGLTDVDLNYPDHLGTDPRATGNAIRDLGLTVNGLAMRYYSNPAFKIGAFTNPDPAVRREARGEHPRAGHGAARNHRALGTLLTDRENEPNPTPGLPLSAVWPALPDSDPPSTNDRLDMGRFDVPADDGRRDGVTGEAGVS